MHALYCIMLYLYIEFKTGVTPIKITKMETTQEQIAEFWTKEYNGKFTISGNLLLCKNNRKRPVAKYNFKLNTAILNNMRESMPMEKADYHQMVKEDFEITVKMLGEEINTD